MFRKTVIGFAAIASLATVALAPTSASAGHRHYHHRHGHGWVGPALIAGAILGGVAIAAESSCYRRRWVETPHGMRKVRVYVC